MKFNPTEHPHKRWNPLLEEWLLVSPHRTKRPWSGKIEEVSEEQKPEYAPDCYLCPGNKRAGGATNPDFENTFVFANDFSAMHTDVPPSEAIDTGNKGLLVGKPERGICRVIVFSPRHDLTIPEMDLKTVRGIVDLWTGQYRDMGSIDYINHVMIFENKGEIMGCSNPHPHGQIWANETIPTIPAKKLASQKRYFEKNGSCLLCDYIKIEKEQKERILFENDSFIALVPYWAVWPFEAMLLPKEHIPSLLDINEAISDDLASSLVKLTTKFDNIFKTSFPYSMGIHQSPTDDKNHPECHLHLSFFPPLLRSATIKKFLVGFELNAEPQRDISPEVAAEIIRSQSDQHYKLTKK